METRPGAKEVLRCSFCRKSYDKIEWLITSPAEYEPVYICDGCVAICDSILIEGKV
jgi:ATP-dependent protease Clp ATPase subunit